MRRKLIARTAKLLSESKKSRRHQGIAVAYEHIPNDIDERNHGAIYAVVNINAPADKAEEAGEMIIDTFHGEFYQDLGRDPMSSFEAALSRVNEELAEITHQGNTAWLGNLNAVLAVLTDETLHVTQTGKAEAYLYRGGRASHITHDLAGDNVNPLRTFTNVASGELLEGDKVAITSPGVFFHISKDELQKYVQEFQPKVAISHIADLLEDNSGEVHPNAILLLEAITPEAASEETVQELDDEIWITEPAKPVQTAIEASAPVAKKTYSYTKRAFSAIGAFVANSIWPNLKKISRDGVDIVKHLPSKNEKVLSDTEESIITEGAKENLEDLTVNEVANELVAKPEVTSKNAIYIKETVKKPKFLKIDLSSTKGLTGRFTKMTSRFGKNKKAVLFAAIALVLILAGSLFGYWKVQSNAEKQELAEASLTEAENKFNTGQTQITSGDKEQADATLRSALALAEGLTSDANLATRAQELAAKIRTALDSAEGVIRAEALLFGDASQITGSNTFGPYLIGTNLYLISKESGSIASIGVSSGEVARVLDEPNIEGNITSATAVPVRSVLVFMTDAGKIYEFDTKDVKLNQQTVAGEFEKSAALASFSTNIYSLDSSTGKIYKRLKTSSGYGARTEYITDGSTANEAVSLAIDSNIYTMKANGEIIQYLGGKKQDYIVSGLIGTVASATSVFTNEDTTGLYELEGNASRVIRYDSDGKFLNQYVANSFKNATGLYVDDTAKTLYVVAGGKIYKSVL